jgi:hypothetical protein
MESFVYGNHFCASEQKKVRGYINKYFYIKGASCVQQLSHKKGETIELSPHMKVKAGESYAGRKVWGFMGGEVVYTWDHDEEKDGMPVRLSGVSLDTMKTWLRKNAF